MPKKTPTESGAAKPKKASTRKKPEPAADIAQVGVDASSGMEPGGADTTTGKKRTRKGGGVAPETASSAAEAKTAPPEVEPGAGAIALTTIIARADVGYGHTLYLRGEGGELSWDKGVALENTGNDEWSWSTNLAGSETLTFKFLIDDQRWSSGDNFSVAAGETSISTPTF